MHTRTRTLPLLLALLAVATSCTEDPLLPTHQLEVGASDLPRLAGDAYYELWVSVPESGKPASASAVAHGGNTYQSVGRFRINSLGKIEALDGGVATFAIPDDVNPGLVSDAILTVEDGSATEPGHRMLAGVFTGTESLGIATLRLNGSDAFGSRIGGDSSINAAGSFVLETPTTDSTGDYPLGIWFLRFIAGAPEEPSLVLPELPLQHQEYPGWIYEAWVIRKQNESIAEEYISLGRFTSPTAPDVNGPGPHAGPNLAAAYPVPGEDFITYSPTRFLEDGTYRVVVSLQPDGIEQTRPVVVLLQNERIPSPVSYRQSDTLVTPSSTPVVTIRIER